MDLQEQSPGNESELTLSLRQIFSRILKACLNSKLNLADWDQFWELSAGLFLVLWFPQAITLSRLD